MDNYILEKMEEEKESAVEKILSLSKQTANIDDIVNTIVYAYLESFPSANKLIHDADLSKTELCALLDDQEKFYELHLEELSYAIGEAQYELRNRD